MSYGTEHECVIVVLFSIILKFQRKKVERRAPFRVHQGALFCSFASLFTGTDLLCLSGKLSAVQV
jgi:hypothetical protein